MLAFHSRCIYKSRLFWGSCRSSRSWFGIFRCSRLARSCILLGLFGVIFCFSSLFLDLISLSLRLLSIVFRLICLFFCLLFLCLRLVISFLGSYAVRGSLCIRLGFLTELRQLIFLLQQALLESLHILLLRFKVRLSFLGGCFFLLLILLFLCSYLCLSC